MAKPKSTLFMTIDVWLNLAGGPYFADLVDGG